MSDLPAFYIRLEKGRETLNLLLRSPDTNTSLMFLFRRFAEESGSLSYYDSEECCIVTLRSRDYTGLRVYQYDDIAPYDGVYLDSQFIEAWE